MTGPGDAGDPAPVPAGGGRTLLMASDVGTIALVAVSGAGAIGPDRFGLGTAVVASALFAVGTVGLAWGFLVGLGRSREEAVTLGGLFLLSGVAPTPVRRRLLLALAVQTTAGVAAASVRPYTAVAFAVLGPMFGFGLMALWSARHGRFGPRGG